MRFFWNANLFANTPGLLVLYVSVLLDILSVGIVIPFLPYYVIEKFGGDASAVGLLGTVYGVAQLFGGPLMGWMSDRYGRKLVLMISFFGTALGYLGTGLATSFLGLLMSRIPIGLVKQTLSISKAYISDVTDDQNRAKYIGFVGMTMGIGFIIGPLIGGLLILFGNSVPPFVSCALFMLNLIFVWIFLPDRVCSPQPPPPPPPQQQLNSGIAGVLNVKGKKDTSSLSSIGFSLWSSLEAFREVFENPLVRFLLTIHFGLGLSLLLFRSNFLVIIQNRFSIEPFKNGLIMSYFGVLDVLCQTFLIGFVTKRLTESQIVLYGLIVLSMNLAILAFSFQFFLVFFLLVPFVMSHCLLHTVLTSLLTRSVQKTKVGLSVGIADAFDSFRVITPSLGGILIAQFGSSTLLMFCSAITFSLGLYTSYHFPYTSNVVMSREMSTGEEKER